jgi:uncharacterized iron-regulated membrane protein
MGRIRKAIFWVHLAAGILAGLIILVMSVTGVLLTYERQITERADGFNVAPASQTVGLEKLLENRKPSAVIVDSDPTRPVALQFGRTKTEFFNPHTGEPMGEGNKAVRGFFKSMLMWHRWLGREGASQPTGKAIIGAGNLVFLFLVVSGIFLWCPKRWTLSGLRLITLFQRRLKGRGRDWNWHNVLGFWSAIPLFFIVVSGVVMSYPWANALVYQLAGETAPPAGGGGAGGRPPKDAAEGNLAGIDAALAAVQAANPGWKTIQLQLPPGKSASFAVADTHRGRPDLRRQVTVDLASSQILKSEGMEAQSTGRKARTWLRWIHTGEAGGFAGQTIAGLASAAAIVLVWTGFALSWRRFFFKRRAV